MTFDAHDFPNLKQLSNRIRISIANGTSVEAIGVGLVPIVLENGAHVIIYDVLSVPKLDQRLLSIPGLVSKELKIGIIRVQMIEKMYALEETSRGTKEQQVIAAMATGDKSQDVKVWHARLGHFPENKIHTTVPVLYLSHTSVSSISPKILVSPTDIQQ